MAFVNEYIPEEDKKKYDMTPDSNFYLASTTNWTVDRERDMFLIRRTGGGAEGFPIHHWAFCWRGHLLDVRMEMLDAGGDPSGGHGWEHTKVHGIGNMTPELQSHRAQIIEDLKSALMARKGGGVYSRRTSYEVTLDTE